MPLASEKAVSPSATFSGDGFLLVSVDGFVRDSEALPGDYVKVQVRDTGVGFPASEMSRIFEPFYTTKGPENGTGLGLSTALAIVNSHNGFITVESEPENGSSFTVSSARQPRHIC